MSMATLLQSFSLLLIVIVVEVASGIWIWVNREPLSDFTRSKVMETVQKDYESENNNNVREIWDTLQAKVICFIITMNF